MKTKLYSYLTLFLAACIILSCGDDGDGTKPQPAATFEASKTTVKIGEEIQFTNNSENATAFKWSFGDGTTSKEVSPKKSYTSSGTFVVSLLSTGAGGSKISNVEITVIPDPEIYFTEYNADLIRRFATGSPDNISDFLDIAGMGGPGIAYDAVNEKIYFSDFDVTGEGKIWRINLDGTDLEAIVDGLYDPYQIALDVEGGKVYWSEDLDGDDIGHIGRANLDGSDKENIVSMEDGQFYSLALDLDNNKVYYGDWWGEVIYRANLDGSDEEPVIYDVYGYALEIDEVNDKIYFNENETYLSRADLDGENMEIIDNPDSRIYGIAIDNENNKLYWSARDAGTITSSNLDGTHKTVMVSGLSSVRGLFLKK
ncbi:MAG TPA: DUF5050 domain-containing protein [Ohtaekwangia sp.]